MKDPSQTSKTSAELRKDPLQGDLSAATLLRRRSDPLLRLNLAPLLGRRDAAFDTARKMAMDFSRCSGAERGEIYWQINRLLKTVCADSRQILTMFTGKDTIDREERFIAFATMLTSLSDSLANFFELHEMTVGARQEILYGGANKLDDDDAGRIAAVMSSVESALLMQFKESFTRSRNRLSRYRDYVTKNFSPENAERYEMAYQAGLRHCMKSFGKAAETSGEDSKS